jgi:glycosyltransferase involved in cell wall biosynthesis
LIPIKFPRFYSARDFEVFSKFFRDAIGFTDRFICISRCTAADLAAFARAQGCDVDIRIERLGADAVLHNAVTASTTELEATKLEAGRYVLYVSTIEPRKNHAMLLRAWRRLAAGEQGGTRGFKLLLAGRRGWMTDDVQAILADDATANSGIVYLESASDTVLDALYKHAEFCVYPSLYEGFGLPVIEAFAHGRPVIASTGGAVPEAAGELAPCIDPNDEDAWVAAIGRWLGDPQRVAALSQRIREEFSWPAWPEAARRIIAVAREA